MPLSAIIAASFLASLLARPLALRLAPHAGWVLALVPAALFIAFLILGAPLRGADALVESVEWAPSLGLSLTFRLDGFSWLFCLLITGIGTLVTIYAGAYFSQKPAGTGASFLALILLFMSAMLGTVLSDNLVALYVFWELTSLVSFLLIGFDSHKAYARKSALQSLIVTAGGGLCLFAGILLIGAALGTFSLSELAGRADELAASPLAPAILILVLLGAFTKSAQVPFHFWLPNAMAAPTPASAYLHSATMVKLGVYLLARMDAAFAQMPAFGATLIVFGLATMIVAGVRAFTQPGLKALLAQSTVGSLGLLVMLIGLDAPLAATATVLFILAHALYKATLFFCAGTAIHATARVDATDMSGLRRALPWTGAAALLAALAMAGLPPALAFIAKETLFEAQIEGAAGWLVIGLSVLGNAALATIALLAAWRVFFAGQLAPVPLKHTETPGLILGPVVLAALGLLFGLAPGLIAERLIAPAASAIATGPSGVSLALWHGFTPPLFLSAAVVLLGLALYASWFRIQPHLAASTPLVRFLGDTGYTYAFEGVLALARRSTRILQNGDQRLYTATVVASVVAIVLYGLVSTLPPIAFDTSIDTLRLAPAILLGFMVAGAIAAARSRSLVAALVATGIVGFGSALIFLLNGAPDLALTQFSVEALVMVIFMALLLRLPIRPERTRTLGERRFDIALSAAFAALVFAALAAMPLAPLDLRLTEYYAAASYPEAFGRNVVNVILVDFRALDTMGEIAVVGFGALAVWGLLRRRARHVS